MMQLAASMVHLFKNSSLVAYGGDYAVGAHGISNSISTTIFLFILGLAIGMQPVVGYNFGAGNIHRVKEAFIKTVRLNVIIGVVGIVITQLFTEGLVRCFTTDDELIRVSKEAVRIENMAFWAVGFQVTCVHFFQSIGSAKQAMILSISRQVAFLIPLIYFLPMIWELKGVWLATPVADVLSFTISLTLIVLFFRKHKEEKKV